jgi:crossover junction endodeoxyribonuclease RusA
VIELTLPVPPSVNKTWRAGRRGMYLSAETKRFRQEVELTCKALGVRPLDGPVWVIWTWYRGMRSGDLSNRTKALYDSLNGLAWHDDAQIVEEHAFMAEDKQRPRVELVIGRAA